VGRPTFAYKGITLAGPTESPDQIERVVSLKGERFDVREGETLTFTGAMRLLSHPRARVNGAVIPAWWENRVEL
jgi:hypothetical protein